MIPEPIAIKISELYFKERLRNPPIRQLSGAPDFLIEGQAIEVKGSDSDFNRAMLQFFDYTLKYITLFVVFPTDFLSSSSRLFKFNLLCNSSNRLHGKTIYVVLICEVDDYYYVREIAGYMLLREVTDEIANEKKAIKEIRSLNKHIQHACFQFVRKKPDKIIPKSIIENLE